jgi:hypothetical protein
MGGAKLSVPLTDAGGFRSCQCAKRRDRSWRGLSDDPEAGLLAFGGRLLTGHVCEGPAFAKLKQRWIATFYPTAARPTSGES